MRLFFHDFELRSERNLEIDGHSNYIEHPSTKAILLSYAFDEGPVSTWEPQREPMPAEVGQALLDPAVLKVAFNASFERLVWRQQFAIDIPIAQFLDIMIWTRHMSIPYGLERCCQILQVDEAEAKMAWGTKKDPGEAQKLIEKFCFAAVDAKITPLFGEMAAFFNDWDTNPVEWERFREYNKGDVRSARAVLRKIGRFRLPCTQQRGWILDQKINERGVPINMQVVNGAINVAERAKAELKAEATRITQLPNVNSDEQMLGWLQKHGYKFGSLQKGIVKRAVAGECPLDEQAKRVIELRKQFKRTSDSKLHTIRQVISPDHYLRHQFAYMGAARTGRWSGHEVQLQNQPLPVASVSKPERMALALELLSRSDFDAIVREFENPMDVVASCIRGTIQAPRGKRLTVSDLNAIENRVLGWAADCPKILDVFRLKRDPYIAFAVYMYKQTYEALWHEYKVLGKKDKRQMAKPAVLGAGYRLGGGEEMENKDGDIIKTGLWGYAANMGIHMTREEAHSAVQIFRDTYPEVKQFWYDLENAAMAAMQTRQPQAVGMFTFEVFEDFVLRIMLPSGRGLHYLYPQVLDREFMGRVKPTLHYQGIDQVTKQWTTIATHGGKLCENVVQATARDVLLDGMVRADEMGFNLIGTVHDEIISLDEEWCPLDHKDLEACMSVTPYWAPGLPLGAEGWSGPYYRKG